MRPTLQASVLAAGSERVGRLMGNEELAETHYEYVQAMAALRSVDPNNRLLTRANSPEWLPSNEDVAEVQAAVRAATAPTGPRPDWLQSEQDDLKDGGPTRRPQVSFKDQLEVPYGTPGSVRPDSVEDGIATFEVKNHNMETNLNGLIRNVADQAIRRAEHLPSQLIQRIVIDIRGQDASDTQRQDTIKRIVKRSGGVISPDAIQFKGGSK